VTQREETHRVDHNHQLVSNAVRRLDRRRSPIGQLVAHLGTTSVALFDFDPTEALGVNRVSMAVDKATVVRSFVRVGGGLDMVSFIWDYVEVSVDFNDASTLVATFGL
jgi:hypothetical protein